MPGRQFFYSPTPSCKWTRYYPPYNMGRSGKKLSDRIS